MCMCVCGFRLVFCNTPLKNNNNGKKNIYIYIQTKPHTTPKKKIQIIIIIKKKTQQLYTIVTVNSTDEHEKENSKDSIEARRRVLVSLRLSFLVVSFEN